MPAPVSVIIPTLNSADTLGGCLADLSRALSENLIAEVIFADGGSEDATPVIAEEVGATLLRADKGRGSQLAAAAREARGEWLFFLHADSRLPEDWAALVLSHISASREAACFRLRFDTTHPLGRVVAAWANLRTRLFGMPFGDQGMLIPRRLYDEIGGFPAIPLMEDVALAKRLRGRVKLLAAPLTTSAEKYRANGWIRQSLGNALLRIRYRFGASPEVLAERYYRG